MSRYVPEPTSNTNGDDRGVYGQYPPGGIPSEGAVGKLASWTRALMLSDELTHLLEYVSGAKLLTCCVSRMSADYIDSCDWGHKSRCV